MKLFLTLVIGIATLLPLTGASLIIAGTITTAASGGLLNPGDTFSGRIDYTATPAAASDQLLLLDELGADIRMSLDFAGTALTELSDPANSFPAIHLGDNPGIDFFAPLPSSPSGSFLQLYPDGSLVYSLDGSSEFEGTYTALNSVPEPNLMLSITCGMAWIILLRKRP